MTIAKRLSRHSNSFFSEQIENPTDEEVEYNKELVALDCAFIESIENMPKEKALDILWQIEEQDRRIESLEKAEFESSKFFSDSYIQQSFFQDTGWYYPDDEYVKKIKDRF